MIVLGLDPGTHTTGWGVVRYEASRVRHVDNGLFQAKRATDDLAERLKVIYRGIAEIIALHRPDVVAVEAVFAAKNAQSALILGHARGVALLAAAEAGLRVLSYPPALVKKTVSGRGRADKFQIQMMVKTLLGLPEVPAEDAADALALGICHCHHITDLALQPPASVARSTRARKSSGFEALIAQNRAHVRPRQPATLPLARPE
ncbi:MAG: crossover junction endodeoxyribonuclease RuvC [Myxococcales bacterium]|nr:crossover junction endodeoxyribonuclease RuvC [Myxococcales bacterium]